MRVKFYLSTTEMKSGERLVFASLSNKEYRLRLTCGYTIRPGHWDSETQRAKPSAPHAKKINARLDTIETTFEEMTGDKEYIKTAFYKTVGKEELQERSTSTSKPLEALLTEYANEHGKLTGWSEGTYGKYKTLKKHLKEIKPNATCKDIGPAFIEKFRLHFIEGNRYKNSYIAKISSFFLTVLLYGKRKGYISENTDLSSLSGKRLTVAKKPVIFLTEADLKKLTDYKLPVTEQHLDKLRDFFLFCCYTGLRYSDAAALRPAHVQGETIVITTKKDTDTVIIPLLAPAKAIIEKYKDNDTGYLIPTITNQKSNIYIKQLCKDAGIKDEIVVTDMRGGERTDTIYKKYELITTHTGRKTFICMALAKGIPPNIVMQITGHSDYNAMRPYIAVANSEVEKAMKELDNKISGKEEPKKTKKKVKSN